VKLFRDPSLTHLAKGSKWWQKTAKFDLSTRSQLAQWGHPLRQGGRWDRSDFGGCRIFHQKEKPAAGGGSLGTRMVTQAPLDQLTDHFLVIFYRDMKCQSQHGDGPGGIVIQMAEGRKKTRRTNKGKRTNTIGQRYRVMAYLWTYPQQTMELSEEDDEDDEVEAGELYTVHESSVLGRRGRCYDY